MRQNLINKELMKIRVKQYGNNFPKIAQLWNKYILQTKNIKVNLTPEDTAILMMLMKKTRLLNQLQKNDYLTDIEDYNNYKFISQNYLQYVSFTK